MEMCGDSSPSWHGPLCAPLSTSAEIQSSLRPSLLSSGEAQQPGLLSLLWGKQSSPPLALGWPLRELSEFFLVLKVHLLFSLCARQ